ncbi:MAG: DUF1326 domain-containing protein [bacterium]|nr:DUF1326 domain-containing protein [bacterium]
MSRPLAVLAVMALTLTAGCNPQLPADEGLPHNTAWSIKADYTDACSCRPTCPCLFGSPATLGHCEGVTLVEIESGHYGDVRLDGVKVLAVYRGGNWIKFYVSEEADEAQTEAAVELLPTFEQFFASDNVLEVKNVSISVERTTERMNFSTPNTTAEIEVMKGKNGKPIKIQNLPSPDFPAPPYLDHTQYRTVILRHEAEDKQFEYSGTNGFTARIEAVAADAE